MNYQQKLKDELRISKSIVEGQIVYKLGHAIVSRANYLEELGFYTFVFPFLMPKDEIFGTFADTARTETILDKAVYNYFSGNEVDRDQKTGELL